MDKCSKEISNGTVTYIENLTCDAKKRDGYDEHAHYDELEIYYFIEGDLYFSFEGEPILVSGGDVIIIASGYLHRTVIRTNCRYYRKRLLIKNDLFARLPHGGLELYNRLKQKELIYLDRESAEQLKVDEMLCEVERQIEKNTALGDLCASVAILPFLVKAEQLGGEEKLKRKSLSKTVDSIIKYIDANISGELSYKAMASEFHLSEKGLYKLFKNETGCPLAKYVRIKRLSRARQLLTQGILPSVASEEAGFTDYSVFYRCFVNELGISPSKYIALYGLGHTM